MRLATISLLLFINITLYSETIELWHRWNKEECVALTTNIANFEAKTGHTVIMKYLDYKILSDKFINSSKAGSGPDLIITKASMIETFMLDDLLNPINNYVTDVKQSQFIATTLQDAFLDDKLYGLPLTYKLLALIYNKDIIEKPPMNTKELFKIGQRFTDINNGYYGLAYPVEDYYYHIPWITSYNGKLVNNKEVYFNSKAHKDALCFVRSLQLGDDAIMPEGVNYDLMLSLFIEGRVPMIINGTWIIGDLIKNNMNVGAAPIPLNSESGEFPHPYGTSELIIMSKFSTNKKTAYELMDFLTSEDAQLVSSKIGHLPTISSVFDMKKFKEGETYEILSGFKNQAEIAISEPKDDIMSKVVWPLGASMLREMLYDNSEVDDRLNRFQNNAIKMINELK